MRAPHLEAGPPRLDAGEVHVWWAKPSFARPEHLALLDAAEREREAALRRPEDRARFRTGCAVIRLTVGGYLGIAPADVPVDRRCLDCDRAHGKPAVPGGLEISLSHSGDRVVLAAARGHPVGVDVEVVSSLPDFRGMARAVLAPGEEEVLATVADADLPEAFLRYWTRKEAVVKATGAGLRTPLRSIEVSPPEAPARIVRGPDAQLYDLTPGPGYLAALAVIGPPGWRVTELSL